MFQKDETGILNFNKFIPNIDGIINWLNAPICISEMLWYANPYTISLLRKRCFLVSRNDRFVADGNLMVKIIEKTQNIKCESLNFDFSGCADPLLSWMEKKRTRLALIGGKETDIKIFLAEIKKKYPRLNIIFYHHGYFSDEELFGISNTLNNKKPDVVIVSMGSPKQENICVSLKNYITKPCKFITTGAFISQTSKRIDYYPETFVKLKLRWLYRAFKEPHVKNRILKHYLPFWWKWKILGKSPFF